MKKLEAIFEFILWESRFVVLFAVIASMITSFAMFYLATVDAYYLVPARKHSTQ